MSNTSCGIDFGTTNSAISVNQPGKNPELVMFKNGKNTMPTAIFYPKATYSTAKEKMESKTVEPLFGEDAVESFINYNPGRFMRSMKRILGTDIMSYGTRINGFMVQFEHILAQFVDNLKKQAEMFSGATIENVVMGRPVHFVDGDEAADLRAENELEKIAKSVGFKNVEFQFEPIAAAYAHEVKISNEKLALVVDIGGGTSDFSIIKVGAKLQNKTDRLDDILSSTGVRVGGNDFDKDLSLKCFMPEFGFGSMGKEKFAGAKVLQFPNHQFCTISEWSRINDMYVVSEINQAKKMLSIAQEPEKLERFLELLECETGHTLLAEVEKSKICLTKNDFNESILDFVFDKPKIRYNRESFEQSILGDVDKISKSLNECILQAKIKPEKIDMVIMTGGSTEIPLVQKIIGQRFPNAEISQDDKLSSVGLGLAYDGKRRYCIKTG